MKILADFQICISAPLIEVNQMIVLTFVVSFFAGITIHNSHNRNFNLKCDKVWTIIRLPSFFYLHMKILLNIT